MMMMTTTTAPNADHTDKAFNSAIKQTNKGRIGNRNTRTEMTYQNIHNRKPIIQNLGARNNNNSRPDQQFGISSGDII